MMKILVANLGSTSFKYRLFDMTDERVLARGGVPRGIEIDHEGHRWIERKLRAGADGHERLALQLGGQIRDEAHFAGAAQGGEARGDARRIRGRIRHGCARMSHKQRRLQ